MDPLSQQDFSKPDFQSAACFVEFRTPSVVFLLHTSGGVASSHSA